MLPPLAVLWNGGGQLTRDKAETLKLESGNLKARLKVID